MLVVSASSVTSLSMVLRDSLETFSSSESPSSLPASRPDTWFSCLFVAADVDARAVFQLLRGAASLELMITWRNRVALDLRAAAARDAFTCFVVIMVLLFFPLGTATCLLVVASLPEESRAGILLHAT